MQKHSSAQKAAPPAAPMLHGSWNGKSAYRLSRKVLLNVIGVSVVYLFISLILSFDSIALRAVFSFALVGLAFGFLYNEGLRSGESDAALAEIMYERDKEGKSISSAERDRCFHPVKGFFAVLIGVLPFVLIAAVFAILTKPAAYTLGMLPGWVQNLTRQDAFGDALQYYAAREGMNWLDICRIVVRAMVMPFVSVAVLAGDRALLLVERLSPLLVCIAPLGFGFGYRGGPRVRAGIHQSIRIGDTRKKQRARKERRRRQRSSAPERLI